MKRKSTIRGEQENPHAISYFRLIQTAGRIEAAIKKYFEHIGKK